MVLEEFRLDGRVAIVTGGGRGLGRTIALALAEAGADIAVFARTSEEVEETAGQVRNLGRRTLAGCVDVRVEQQVEEMAAKTAADLGRIDILVNCAGLGLEKPFLEITEEEWRRVVDTNLTGTFLCCRIAGKHLVEQGHGKIINVASGLAIRGIEKGAAFCASKGGVVQLTRALALEWAPLGVRVNAIGPGWFPSSPGGQGYQEAEALLERFIPMKRWGRPEDVAGAAIYLASDSSSFVTGEVIWVDGGILAHL